MRKGIGNGINEKIMQKYIHIHGTSGSYIVGVQTALLGGHASERYLFCVRRMPPFSRVWTACGGPF